MKAIAAARGVASGIHVATAERALAMMDRGYQFISVASDAALMASAAAAARASIRTAGAVSAGGDAASRASATRGY